MKTIIKGNENLKFVITSEHLAQERAKLDAREEQLKADRAKLDEFERDAIRLAESFESAGPEEMRPLAKSTMRLAKSTLPRKPPTVPRERAPEHNRVYTPEQIEILRTASRADLAQLAKAWGRTHDGLEKKREELRSAARREAVPGPVAVPAPEEPVSEPKPPPYLPDPGSSRLSPAGATRSSSPQLRPEQADQPESEDVFENTSDHEWNRRSIRSSLRPGKPVSGIIDNGPGDRRVLDPSSFSSKNYL